MRLVKRKEQVITSVHSTGVLCQDYKREYANNSANKLLASRVGNQKFGNDIRKITYWQKIRPQKKVRV
jgi:hypothetical protein